MKKAGAIVICCLVLQIAQSEILTLAMLSLGGLYLSIRLICEAGERGVL